jgi:uncharacterized protein (UPF0335 family)
MQGRQMSMKSDVADSLKSYLDRIERLEQERKSLGDDIRSIYADAKANGFDPKAIRAMVKRRAKDANKVAEEETILETYMHAVGMITENPLSAAVSAMSVDTLARDQVIDAFKQLVPMHGEIIAKVGGAPLRLWRGEDGIARVEDYVEPKAAPAEKLGKHLKKSATVLSIVPADSVKAAADAAEARSKTAKPPADEASADADADEPA